MLCHPFSEEFIVLLLSVFVIHGNLDVNGLFCIEFSVLLHTIYCIVITRTRMSSKHQ